MKTEAIEAALDRWGGDTAYEVAAGDISREIGRQRADLIRAARTELADLRAKSHATVCDPCGHVGVGGDRSAPVRAAVADSWGER